MRREQVRGSGKSARRRVCVGGEDADEEGEVEMLSMARPSM
jgi:hypothetical protein